MTTASSDVLSRLLAVLAEPLASGTPLPPGEDEAMWRARALSAAHSLAPRFDAPAGFDHTLGSALGYAADTPMPPGLSASPGRTRLVGELVRNLAHPNRINQGHKGTCSVACVEAWLSESLPAEYARLVAELMDEDGDGRLLNGDVISRDEDRLAWAEAEARRSPTSRLFQVAAMEYAYPELDYRNATDGQFQADGADTGTGLGLDAFDRLLEGLTGTRWDRLSVADEATSRAMAERFGLDLAALPDLQRDAPAIIRSSLTAGDGVFVTLDATRAAAAEPAETVTDPLLRFPHKVRVLKIDDETERVWYDDPLDPEKPWMPGVETVVENDGGHCSMRAADFYPLVVELSCLPAHARQSG